MTLKAGDPWFGHAPAAVAAHEYVVAYHPKLRFRVAVKIPERDKSRTLTVFCPDPHPGIESQIRDGGPFFVNEWKQVLKPHTGEEGYRVVTYLGEFPDLHFVFKYKDKTYDNANTDGLSPGDLWPHQETGMQYKYDLREATVTRRIVRWEDFAVVEDEESLGDPPEHLLRGLEAARPRERGGRFYVNEHGVAFAPADESGAVQMVYAGRIDVARDRWFEKHEGESG